MGKTLKTGDLNDASYWWPRLEGLDQPLPETTLIGFDPGALFGLLGEDPSRDAVEEWERVLEQAREAAKRIGYPVFVRTGQASTKHRGADSYRAAGDDELASCLSRAHRNGVGKLMAPSNCFLVREWLDLDVDPAFEAFGGHTIGREYRVFAKPGHHYCTHYYWPEDAIEFWGGVDEPPDWRTRLEALDDLGDPSRGPDLVGRALEAVRELAYGGIEGGEAWSLDYAQTTDGEWVLIDAALARSSWHPEDCPNPQRWPTDLQT